MGYSSIVQFGGVRIGGISGIWKGRYYKRGYYEQAPYTAEELRSVYYIREYEVIKMKMVRWPFMLN
jgi:lariat debranching enzyme